ncbi:MAG: medium chain dehydrogenase/reductase family protein [Paludibacter sp.]
MQFKSIIISKKGGPEVLEVIEKELVSPGSDEVLIKVQACAVGGTDITMRYFNYPGVPKIPFVPGYEIVGTVQETGPLSTFKVGDRVGALTTVGGYAEYIILKPEHLIKVPKSVDAAEAAAVILNYTTAYQMLKRVAKVKAGDKVLITGASGGVGTALLDLGKLFKLELYGTASYQKHEFLKHFDATIIDHKTRNFVSILNQILPQGLDYVFDGIGGAYIKRSINVLHRGGLLVEYGYSLKSFSYFMKSLFDMFSGIPKGVKAKSYGISVNYKMNKQPVLDDMAELFKLLEDGKIKPLIYKRMPLIEAAKANRLLENGGVVGNVVLINH